MTRFALAGFALAFGMVPLSAQQGGWAVPGAPFRAVFRAEKEGPTFPEAGWLLEVPELGNMLPAMDDVVVTGADGKAAPAVRLFRNEGLRSLVLAQTASTGGELHVYFGGRQARRATPWAAKPGLLLETKRLPDNTKIDAFETLHNAWNATKASDGAGFVATISTGGNPFGEASGFMSKFTGWLKLPSPKTTLYTVSSDASFVFSDGKPVVAWPGVHGALTNAKAVPMGEISSAGAPLKIEYWHAKSGGEPATMVLGYMDGDKAKEIPASWWMKAGRTSLVKLEHAAGWPVVEPGVTLHTYIGWNNAWYYDAEFRGAALPDGWTARWEFGDGAVFDGANCRRVAVGNAPLRATLVLTRGKDEVRTGTLAHFHGTPNEASINNPGDVRHYVGLMNAEKPERLAPETLNAHLAMLRDFGDDDVLGRYGAAWLARNKNHEDPLWLTAQLARIRSISQRDPDRALQEIRQFDAATMKRFAKELGLLKLDIIVFGKKDAAEAANVANRLAFENPNSDIARLAKIRIGDAYRLLGKPESAVEIYRSVQKTVADETAGRKFAAGDRANSVTLESILAQGERNAAMEKLLEWEADHPMGKYESDFLLLRGRVLMEFARWNEALQEVESFRAMHPDSPYQIIADFHRARAIARLGRGVEAQKIWREIATKYPKHELAAESARYANEIKP